MYNCLSYQDIHLVNN